MPIYTNINPSVLIWAREQAGLQVEEVAKRIGISAIRLREWESGESFPTVRQLRLAGKAYRRPSAFFYLPKPPPAPPDLKDFRTAHEVALTKSPALLYEIRRARTRRTVALDLLEDLKEDPIEFILDGSFSESPQHIANRIRKYLKIDLTTQFSWRDRYEALRSWIEAIEMAGILVSQYSGVTVSEARGFSIADRPLPLIAINAGDSPRGRIFTLMHEVAHLVLNLGGLCDLHDEITTHNDIEPFCNSVAAEILVPESAILSEDIVIRNDSPEWSNDDLRILANRFMVSQEVILRRLLSLGRTTDQIYKEKRISFLEQYSRIKRKGFIEYYRKVLRNNGNTYTALVITAFQTNAITANDVSRYLGNVKLKHVDSIAHELNFF
jgi:Zn-dependent peptidase ImmA (M78 family)